MKKLLSLLVIPLVLLATPVIAGAATPATTAVFNGTYSYHGTMFVTMSNSLHCKGGTGSIPMSGKIVVSGGAYKGLAIHFTFSSHRDGSVTRVVRFDGVAVTYKYSFSLNFSNVTFMAGINGGGKMGPGCTISIHGSVRGTRISK